VRHGTCLRHRLSTHHAGAEPHSAVAELGVVLLMSASPEILNEALCAYVYSFPRRDRLAEHIAKHQLEAQAADITSALDALLKTAENYLWDYPGGVPWTDAFNNKFRDHLQHAHPWLDSRGFDTITSFSGWLCWHEGLNANTTTA
jgi:hypothetical protein